MLKSTLLKTCGTALLLSLLCLSGPILANPTQNLDADRASVAEYLEFQRELRAAFKEDRPRKLNRDEWASFDRAQEELEIILEGKETAAELNENQRMRVFNAQEQITALIRGTESERVICRRERPTGSNIGVRTCKTVTEINRHREESLRAFQNLINPAVRGDGEG